ncbi:MAG TPA: hypothetical protein VFV94_18175 [Polyangiaceae bacterium]|jgi:hypothetical protein|nr:hypothetical protein [Polyangiaceae bacterium]
MSDLRLIIAAALVVAPVACAHDDRPPQGPEPGTPGAEAPAPSTTNEPSDVESPKLNDSPRQSDPTGAAPVSDSRTRTTPFKVAQASGGTGAGGYGGMPGGGSGGTIITGR